jgi:hypothetical protein
MPQEQNPIKWLLGFKETDAERKAREAREANEKRGRSVVEAAVKQGALPKAGEKKPTTTSKKK